MKTNTNKVELVGFAGMAPEVHEITKGVKVARLTLATTENFRDKTGEWVRNTSWHRVILWNANAELAESNIKKGDRVSVTGKISYRVYEDTQGQKRFAAEITAFECKVIPRMVVAE